VTGLEYHAYLIGPDGHIAQRVDLIRDELDRDPGHAAGKPGLNDIDRLELQDPSFESLAGGHALIDRVAERLVDLVAEQRPQLRLSC